MKDLNAIHISFDNLFVDGFNAITFSMLGMSIVFCGLIIISLYIVFLPKLLQKLGLDAPKGANPNTCTQKTKFKTESNEDEDMVLAIAIALHLELNSGSNQKITLIIFLLLLALVIQD